MRIGILGTGNMAEALGGQWARAGHEVRVGGRSAEHAAELAQRIGAVAGSLAEVAAFGEALLLAVPYDAAPEVLADAGPLNGRIVIDCTNPLVPGSFTLKTDGRSAAENFAEQSGARVVKAFNLCHVDVWRMTPPVFAGRPVAVPLCGEPAAVADAIPLVEALGCHPINAGGLDRAGLLEATAAFVIGMWFAGEDAQAVLPPLEVAHGTA
ncbi:MAG: oxidoreductase, coenzyme F420-dependent [Nocardia sp.]|uniref:NADPH-dependent F420 reductase n=1 Tax=Nocardia sp. TaxID=1821 RepID=UPI00262411F4|nr:NAD(P)-binding domain-containing protein [Nocardia sp.]MCU1647446.1 oxidoreductase, coenzyme F420-dependent [Nocardia sp.]